MGDFSGHGWQLTQHHPVQLNQNVMPWHAPQGFRASICS